MASAAGTATTQTPAGKPTMSDVLFEEIRAAQALFAAQRDWDQYHTPRNLLIALVRGGVQISTTCKV